MQIKKTVCQAALMQQLLFICKQIVSYITKIQYKNNGLKLA